jgi:hypothetical protein
MGRESIMSASARRPVAADLFALLALVADSAIVSEPVEPAALFADWEHDRKSADVDALILSWIASHVPGSPQRGRLH